MSGNDGPRRRRRALRHALRRPRRLPLQDRGPADHLGTYTLRVDDDNARGSNIVRTDVNVLDCVDGRETREKVGASRTDVGESRLMETEDSDVGARGKPRVPRGYRCWRGASVWSAKTVLVTLLAVAVMLDVGVVHARSSEPRYETAYACEGKTLKIGCPEGTVINLIRANYGRFSITICNDHGNTDWSVNCMSTRSLRVLHTRCSNNQNCSILASTAQFGDPCPSTLKYLEAHYQCVTAAPASTTARPAPPWLLTSPPPVWRGTPPPGAAAAAAAAPAERKKPAVITPPTFRPHITMPPQLKPGDIGTKKTTTKQREPVAEKESGKTSTIGESGDSQEDERRAAERERGDKPSGDPQDEAATEEAPPPAERVDAKPSAVDRDGKQPSTPDIEIDGFGRRYEHSTGSPSGAPASPNEVRSCSPAYARGLHWNWTLAGSYAVQPCPGGATGLARWRCMVVVTAEEPRGRGTGGGGLPSGENYLDLGLGERDQLIRRLTTDGRGDSSELTGYPADAALLPGAAALDSPIGAETVSWQGSTPDLSECRSVWLNSLEARVRDGESLLGISNDLAQVTSSKTLYGGDLVTTTTIMKKLAARMAQTVHTFPERGQRVAFVTDMLLGVIKTGSNLLEEGQRAAWGDLGAEAQQRAATALLTQLEENAFLLADAVVHEKNILQIVKNICLSVRVLEVRNVEDETFPSAAARDQWRSGDTITVPRAALLENRENELVRIVFVAFDRLEEILHPVYRFKHPRHQSRNLTKVLNSKVISASLGKGRHIELSQAVHVTLKHIRTDNVSNPICVFWDYTVNVWSPEGCRVEWTNGTHTGCSCSHLTNFAILMDLHSVALPASHALALRVVTLVGCAVSAVALTAAVCVFQCCRNMKSDRVTIHKNLCSCLLIAELIFMAGIDQTQSPVVCGVIAGLLHYFFLAAFAWMFLEGFHLYAMLVEVWEPERPRARWYCAAAYSAPALIVLVSAAVFPAGYGTRRACWLSSDRMFVMSFVGPVALVLAANWICLSMVIYMMCHHSTVSVKAKENSKLYKIRVWLNSSLVLAFLLGLTWTFGLLYLSEQTVGVAYAFTVLNSLQGLFIFVFHCLQNETFQKELGRMCRRHRWLSCCAPLAAPPAAPLPANNHAASSSAHPHSDSTRHGSVKSRRYQQSAPLDPDEVIDPRDGLTNTSSRQHAHGTSTLPHEPRHMSPAPHVAAYSESDEYRHHDAYRKERRRHHHPEHPYQHGQARLYRRPSEHEFRQEDPVYEEIERDAEPRRTSRFYGDHRPLISYSPGGWDGSETRVLDARYHPPESNLLHAVLNAENNVVCHLEPAPHDPYPHHETYPHPAARTLSQPSF